jgi:dUTP pyrophosphatase
MTKLGVKKLHSEAILPEYGTVESACFDLFSVKKVILDPGAIIAVETGLAFEIPKGYEIQIRSKSGLAVRGISVLNSPGTIDSDYKGEIKVILKNSSEETYIISQGKKIAQALLATVIPVELIEIHELSSSERGEGGFGSTGLDAKN